MAVYQEKDKGTWRVVFQVHRFYRGKKADAETWLQDQTGSDCMGT